ncbi:hypothetical protein [Cohnella zeiphila]|uniref:Copper amine oxidase-like N-terminal domain-containing protein n=1 Tax=Cohnella zeiphila TaxID=2761120 RepID=A0A7X0SR08_9BACL|nr:hypothetical protein [Cohnella zeiphila]MBB6733514.1 hypothetical protein [Cohnella zeiphila]
MKNFTKKSVVTLMVLGMTVTGAAGVYAGSNLQKITAYLNGDLKFKVNGAAYTPVDAYGNKQLPISYRNSTYLPVRALADALHVPIYYDENSKTILVGSAAPNTNELADIAFSSDQTKAILQAFANFDGFETAYAPKQMTAGDSYQKAVTTGDGVNLVFAHMIVNVSPRDYSGGYDSTSVTLSNGITAKWYTPGDTTMLGFKLDDRIVTVSSPDHTLSKAQIEKVAASVAKLPGSTNASELADVTYSGEQSKAIRQAFASFDGFETAYAPKQMTKGDAYQKAVATGDGVNLVFAHMIVNVSPRDYSGGYDSTSVTLSNGTKAKWYTPGDTAMLGFQLDDRTVTISSPDHTLSKAQIEKVAVSIAKLT